MSLKRFTRFASPDTAEPIITPCSSPPRCPTPILYEPTPLSAEERRLNEELRERWRREEEEKTQALLRLGRAPTPESSAWLSPPIPQSHNWMLHNPGSRSSSHTGYITPVSRSPTPSSSSRRATSPFPKWGSHGGGSVSEVDRMLIALIDDVRPDKVDKSKPVFRASERKDFHEPNERSYAADLPLRGSSLTARGEDVVSDAVVRGKIKPSVPRATRSGAKR
ncbi:hypothetical protein GYMLUDRAFT_47086 [Collybiopsis luxurians FD-317 M1]|uniref:Uncharacterized protein n=1 Tax=Collybiopsis luxurians FD-317 M1 TaxID=944289 RepID=A0A0D0C1Y0_9AGAR|nr:hypothetical protein GYMLUDRAFT_47086 [Collybiopsis luxurians FD-317 M1]